MWALAGLDADREGGLGDAVLERGKLELATKYLGEYLGRLEAESQVDGVLVVDLLLDAERDGLALLLEALLDLSEFALRDAEAVVDDDRLQEGVVLLEDEVHLYCDEALEDAVAHRVVQ